jgi:hypothetical protein
VKGTTIRWRNVGRIGAGIAALGAALVVAPRLLDPGEPPPLPDDVGLEVGATGFVYEPTPAQRPRGNPEHPEPPEPKPRPKPREHREEPKPKLGADRSPERSPPSPAQAPPPPPPPQPPASTPAPAPAPPLAPEPEESPVEQEFGFEP